MRNFDTACQHTVAGSESFPVFFPVLLEVGRLKVRLRTAWAKTPTLSSGPNWRSRFWRWRLAPMGRKIYLIRGSLWLGQRIRGRETAPVCGAFAIAIGGSRFGADGLVQLGGFEPPTSGSTIRRSNQLSYSCMARGPEPKSEGPQKQDGPGLPARLLRTGWRRARAEL